MAANHFEILVEEPSAEAFLSEWLPRLLNDATFSIHAHQGKNDLLGKLESRLKAYSKWLPDNARIIVLADRDSDECKALKTKLEAAAASAGLPTRTQAGESLWRVVNRIAIEELEAWYFGAWGSVRRAYPRVPANAIRSAALRHSDEISGGTWEAFERVTRRAGYFAGGLRKVEAAHAIGAVFDPMECRSPSFIAFRDAIIEAVEEHQN